MDGLIAQHGVGIREHARASGDPDVVGMGAKRVDERLAVQVRVVKNKMELVAPHQHAAECRDRANAVFREVVKRFAG